ncbi:MAG: putative bifunctional diguanylate cyclase/phosphodiesterase [Acidiferrobacteraceae bacterium]
MMDTRTDPTSVDPDYEAQASGCEILNRVEAAIAFVNTRGEPVFQNDAFARFNAAVRDDADCFENYATLLDCPAVQQSICAALSSGNDSLVRQTFFYGPKMKVDLSLRVRPLIQDGAGVTGATITIGEESVAFDHRYLARMQESLQTLIERVRVLSKEKIGNDRLIRVLFKEAPFAMLLMNTDRQVLHINRAGAQLFGVSEREIVGQTCDALLPCFQTCGHCPVQQGQSKIELDEISGLSNQNRPIPLLRSAMMFGDDEEKVILEAFIDLTERKQAENLLARLGRILDDSANEIYVFDADSLRLIQVNRGTRQNLGYTLEELKALTPLDLKPEFTPRSFEALLAPLRRGETQLLVFETVHKRKDGSQYPVEVRLQLSRSESPPVFVAIIQDITERRQAETQMREFVHVVEQTDNAVVITDLQGNIQYVNPAYERITGYSRLEVLGKNAGVVKSGEHGQRFYEELWRIILAGRVFQGVLVNRKKDGSLYYAETTITPLKDADGNFVRFVSTGKDITERRKADERLHHMAHYDSLTGLPNRTLLQDHLKRAIAEANQRERLVAVMFLDLDRFKTVNDTLGHEIGDALLGSVAERLAACLRPGDTVSRLGGDEFTVVLPSVAHVDDVTHVAQKILDQFLSPFRIAGRDLFVSPSIGITLYPLDEKDTTNLLRDADIAMYRAKELGGNTFQFYTAELNARVTRRLELETGLRWALERQELRLYYQPLVDMKTGRVRGTEALLRWQHPEYGLIPPLDFIPLAEDTGLIIPIGEWVLKTACAQIKAWHDTGFPALQVAVNLSSKQLRDRNLIVAVTQALEAAGLDACYLDLELTESVLMQDMELAGTILAALKKVGVSFSLDDFGTGYSSLSYLKRFPIDYLKVDRSFVLDILTDPVGASLVEAIIAMANVLHIKVIAEGVETYEQLELLRRQGCDIAQGYFCSPPVDAATFTDLLRDWDKTRAGK